MIDAFSLLTQHAAVDRWYVAGPIGAKNIASALPLLNGITMP